MKREPSQNFLFLTIVFLIAMMECARAQMSSSASITVSATIPQSATLVSERQLNVGSVLPGINETIQPNEANAGRIKLMGTPGAEIFLSFMLPPHLTSENDTMAVRFTSTSAIVSETPSGDPIQVRGDPNVGFAAIIGTGANGLAGELYVFLGCSVLPKATQRSGHYNGEVRVTVIYTGN